MNTSDFDYDLPPGLIAQSPLPERDASRMMVVFRKEGKILHGRFKEFPDYLNKDDVLVFNNAKVIPARVWGNKDGKDIEFLFIKEIEKGVWEVLCRPAKRVRIGDGISLAPDFKAEVIAAGDEGNRTLKFPVSDVLRKLKKIGFAPLPPYIKRKKTSSNLKLDDLERYQTVFAEKEGAIAAPTAGLHFTPRILQDIRENGVRIAYITLDVGPATFQPMRVERLEEHKMLEESFRISKGAAAEINRAKKESRPVVAVGTTSVRTLESAAKKDEGGIPKAFHKEPTNTVLAGQRTTSLFIYPGYNYRVVDRLLTNFHLPKSTLLMLVAAFAGRDLIIEAYRQAVREKYRFFSYGDCMLII